MRCSNFLVILLGFCLQANAQISDSLYKALPDTLRPRNKLAVTDKEKFTIILNSSQAFVQKYYIEIEAWTLQLRQKIETVKPIEEKIPYAQAIAGFYLQTGNITDAFNWNRKLVIWGAEGHAYRSAVSNAYLNLSLYYSTKLRQDSAVNMLHQARDIAIVDHDSTSIRDIYYLYMSIYANLFLYHQALDNLNRYLNALPPSDTWKDAYTSTMLTKAAIYGRLYNIEKKTAYADSAEKVTNAVMNAKKAEASIWYHTCYSTLGYLSYYQKDYRQAVAYFDLSLLPKYNEVGASVSELNYRAVLYRNICLILLGHGDVIQKSLALKVPSNDFTTHKALNEAIYHYYSERNDYKNALRFYSQSKAFADSLDVIGQRGKVFEAEQKYSVAQKEAAISQLQTRNLQAEVSRNRIVVTAVIAILLLAILALLLYVRNKRQQVQRLAERQKLTDDLQTMEQEMELDRLRQQAESEAAIVGQRKAISKNMHDEVSSDLAAVRYFIADLKSRVKSSEARQVLADVEEEVQTVYQQSRDFMHRLNENNVPEAYSVLNLLENLSLRFGKGSNLHIYTQMEARLERKLTARQQAEVYKVIKEAVANCLKHSGASRMDIVVEEQGELIMLTINDNGRGIKAELGQGLGLITMQERIEGLGGNLQISPSERGLHIRANFLIGD